MNTKLGMEVELIGVFAKAMGSDRRDENVIDAALAFLEEYDSIMLDGLRERRYLW